MLSDPFLGKSTNSSQPKWSISVHPLRNLTEITGPQLVYMNSPAGRYPGYIGIFLSDEGNLSGGGTKSIIFQQIENYIFARKVYSPPRSSATLHVLLY